MADVATTAQREQVREQGLIGKTMMLPFHFLGVMFGSLMAGILIEWVGLYFFWPEAGWHHAQSMLHYELGWLSSNFTNSVIIQEPGRTATWLVSQVYDFGFVKTGITQWINEQSTQAHTQSVHDSGFKQAIGSAMVYVEDYGLATVYTVLTFLVRLVILVLTVPLFLMAVSVGFIDGLVRRDLRRFGAGLESGFVYHRAKATITPLAVIPWIAYLSLPISISPIFVLLPCAALLGIAVSITAGSFKKYL
ncbi:membrane protein [Pseudomonas luteola]|uniref:Membrane protein n=1 Tax=Pseudomonas luteola TaxID=47886 RepID=A0A2X2C1H5_PSELU|nr:TIGR03747 family integrating conjugative element membrane protein [Pseudomonas luteola]SPZ02562.1 membrane protein [Pseudomonas luteola]